MGRWPFFLLALILLPSVADAGAWVQPSGHGQLIHTSSLYWTGESFDAHGARQENPGFRKFETNPYFEYGLNEKWTLGTSVFLHYLYQEEAAYGEAYSNYGAGNSEAFARYQILQENGFVLAAQPLVALPAHYRQKEAPTAGRPNWDGELALLAGYGFTWRGLDHYVDAKAAYRHRLGVLQDQWRFSATLGLGLTSSLQLIPELNWTQRLREGEGAISVAGQNDYDLLKAQLSLVWKVNERHALQLGGFRHMAGKDTGAGGGLFIALWTQW